MPWCVFVLFSTLLLCRWMFGKRPSFSTYYRLLPTVKRWWIVTIPTSRAAAKWTGVFLLFHYVQTDSKSKWTEYAALLTRYLLLFSKLSSLKLNEYIHISISLSLFSKTLWTHRSKWTKLIIVISHTVIAIMNDETVGTTQKVLLFWKDYNSLQHFQQQRDTIQYLCSSDFFAFSPIKLTLALLLTQTVEQHKKAL